MEGILNQKHNYLKINLMKVQRLIFNLHPTITFFNLTLKQYENKEWQIHFDDTHVHVFLWTSTNSLKAGNEILNSYDILS